MEDWDTEEVRGIYEILEKDVLPITRGVKEDFMEMIWGMSRSCTGSGEL